MSECEHLWYPEGGDPHKMKCLSCGTYIYAHRGRLILSKNAEIARLTREVEEANRKYEKAYDCHGMMCGACISCCVEMLHDTSAKNTILYADLAAARQTIERVRELIDTCECVCGGCMCDKLDEILGAP